MVSAESIRSCQSVGGDGSRTVRARASRASESAAAVERSRCTRRLGPQFGLGGPRAPVDELLLERREEALGDRVVEAVALGFHRRGDTRGARLLTEGETQNWLAEHPAAYKSQLCDLAQGLLAPSRRGRLRERERRAAIVGGTAVGGQHAPRSSNPGFTGAWGVRPVWKKNDLVKQGVSGVSGSRGLRSG